MAGEESEGDGAFASLVMMSNGEMHMTRQPFFSIIMPVYNAAAYVEHAVQSVLGQTFGDLELILVNDCSTDNSDAICRKLEKRDKRVIYYEMPQNSGAAAARNYAMKQARGLYLGFVDADDSIDDTLLEKAYTFLKTGIYDCLKFGCVEEYYDKDGRLKHIKKCKLAESEFQAGVELSNQIVAMEEIPLFGYACNGFYAKAITAMPGIFFDEGLKVNEDFAFNIRFFSHVNRLKCLAEPAYHYAKRIGGSLSGEEKNYTYEMQMMKIHELIGLYSCIDLIPPAIREKIFWMYTRFVYALLVRAKRMGEMSEVKKQISQDQLYEQFYKTEFREITGKQKLMIGGLKKIHGISFRVLLEVIYITKTYLPILFAMVKK